jgi:hypothetical protein
VGDFTEQRRLGVLNPPRRVTMSFPGWLSVREVSRTSRAGPRMPGRQNIGPELPGINGREDSDPKGQPRRQSAEKAAASCQGLTRLILLQTSVERPRHDP